jgi:hypothetical protein
MIQLTRRYDGSRFERGGPRPAGGVRDGAVAASGELERVARDPGGSCTRSSRAWRRSCRARTRRSSSTTRSLRELAFRVSRALKHGRDRRHAAPDRAGHRRLGSPRERTALRLDDASRGPAPRSAHRAQVTGLVPHSMLVRAHGVRRPAPRRDPGDQPPRRLALRRPRSLRVVADPSPTTAAVRHRPARCSTGRTEQAAAQRTPSPSLGIHATLQQRCLPALIERGGRCFACSSSTSTAMRGVVERGGLPAGDAGHVA